MGPANHAANLAADCTVDTAPAAAGRATASATDNCDSDVAIAITHRVPPWSTRAACLDGNAEGSYVHPNADPATATDDCGNTSSDTAVQAIIPTAAPELSAQAPADAVGQLDENCEADLSTDALRLYRNPQRTRVIPMSRSRRITATVLRSTPVVVTMINSTVASSSRGHSTSP